MTTLLSAIGRAVASVFSKKKAKPREPEVGLYQPEFAGPRPYLMVAKVSNPVPGDDEEWDGAVFYLKFGLHEFDAACLYADRIHQRSALPNEQVRVVNHRGAVLYRKGCEKGGVLVS